ncbi:MAG: YkgJ family cysteine cluster protein [bacterium]|nr:YkgJ family cysteine cluster protein [bacterium]
MTFKFNHAVLKNATIERTLWQLIKIELFYITGACQHSGNCCRHLMVVENGTPLSDPIRFAESKASQPHIFSRFYPVSTTQNGTITAYDCKCLTKDNKCNDYPNRPQFCHNYPASAFVSHGKLLEGCGYRIAVKPNAPSISHTRLSALIHTIVQNK